MSSIFLFFAAGFCACVGVASVLRGMSGSKMPLLSGKFFFVTLSLWALGSIAGGLLQIVSLPALASQDLFWNWVESPALCLALFNGIPVPLKELWPALRLPTFADNLGALVAIYSIQGMRLLKT
jgi:hypothetical protein